MDLLLQYAVESGEVAPEGETNDQLVEVLVDQASGAGQDTVAVLAEQAEQTADIAEQLDDLADRAEEVAEQTAAAAEAGENVAELVAVSTESFHREFKTVMRAYKLTISASSFESAGSDKERLAGLIRDARRTANMSRGLRDQMLDYSEEGAILSFIRRDAAKLGAAQGALQAAARKLQSNIGEVREKPVAIKNQGLAKFLTTQGKAVRNLPAAVSDEATYLQKLHDAAQGAANVIENLATRLAKGESAQNLARTPAFSALNTLGSAPGQLLGNFTLRADNVGGEFASLTVPKFSRIHETKVNGKDIFWGILGSISGSMAFTGVLGLVCLGGLAIGAPVAIGAVLNSTGALAGSYVASAAGFVSNVNASQNQSDVKSSASASDMMKSVNDILGFQRMVDYRVDADAISAKLKEARKATGNLDAAGKKFHLAACDALETSLSRLVRLAECVYEQAFYDMTMMAATVDAVVNKAK